MSFPRSQQKFLPRFHSAVLLLLSCRLVAGCCGKLFRKTPLARTMHQPHFVFRLLLLPIFFFFSSALIWRRVFVSIRVILSNVMCRNFSAPEPYLVGELHLVPAGKIKSCLLPLHQKYAGLCNSALSDLSPCYQACHASQDSGPRVFCQEYGFQSPLMESCEQFLCQP